MSATLKSVAIVSYRSCLQTQLPIHKELTTLIGANGSGKTNILQAILLMMKAFGPVRNPYRRRASSKCTINAEFELPKGRYEVELQIDYDTDERNADEVQSCSTKIRALKGKNNQWHNIPSLPRFYGGEYEVRINYRQHRLFDLPEVNKAAYTAYAAIQESIQSLSYYSASQFSDPSKCPVSIELDETTQPLRRLRGQSGHEQFMFALYLASRKSGVAYENYLSTVDKRGIGLVDKIGFETLSIPSSSYEVRAGGRIKRTERNRTMIVPLFTIDGNILSPNQLSEGTFKTLALVFYLLTDKNKLLLIEEPEVCVHHGLLNSILSIVRSQSKRKQIVMSTHSDYVLNHTDLDSIVLVDKEGKKGTQARNLESAMSERDLAALHTYLDKTGNIGDYWRESGFTELQ